MNQPLRIQALEMLARKLQSAPNPSEDAGAVQRIQYRSFGVAHMDGSSLDIHGGDPVGEGVLRQRMKAHASGTQPSGSQAMGHEHVHERGVPLLGEPMEGNRPEASEVMRLVAE